MQEIKKSVFKDDEDFFKSFELDDNGMLKSRQGGKYIKRIPKTGGGYKYIYKEDQKREIVSPDYNDKEYEELSKDAKNKIQAVYDKLYDNYADARNERQEYIEKKIKETGQDYQTIKNTDKKYKLLKLKQKSSMKELSNFGNKVTEKYGIFIRQSKRDIA